MLLWMGEKKEGGKTFREVYIFSLVRYKKSN